MELDGDGLFSMQDMNEELKDVEEEDSDFTGGNVDEAAGLAGGLNNYDSAAIETEEELVTSGAYNLLQRSSKYQCSTMCRDCWKNLKLKK